ncbi:MAG: VTT domain-containing protein [Polyangiales bacterium]
MERSETTDGASERGRLWLLAPLVPIALIALVWVFADLSALKSPESVASSLRSLRDSPYAVLYVVVGFSFGTLLFLPITALMAGTAIAFDPPRALAFAMLGGLCAASVTYWVGRLSGSAALEIASGPRLRKFGQQMRAHSFRASIVARLLPVGNFTMINLLAGSLRIPFRSYFFGNVVGMVPGTLIVVLFAEQLGAALRNPSKSNLLLAGGVIVGGALLVVLLKQLQKRRATAAGSAGDVAQ